MLDQGSERRLARLEDRMTRVEERHAALLETSRSNGEKLDALRINFAKQGGKAAAIAAIASIFGSALAVVIVNALVHH